MVGPAPDENAVEVLPPHLISQYRQGLQQQVDSVLAPHLAEERNEMLLAPLPRRIRRVDPESAQVGAGTHHENPARLHAPSLHGDAAMALVGGDRHVGHSEGHLLQ